MCKKQMSFFYSQKKELSKEKPKWFNHFMLKEILDTTEEIRKNLHFYMTHKDLSYKFLNLVKNCHTVRIFASNKLLDVAIFCKNVLKDRFLKNVFVCDLSDFKNKNIKNKTDVAVFFVDEESLKKQEVLNTLKDTKNSKVIFANCIDNFKKEDSDILFPVFVNREEIKVLTKTNLLFCFNFLLSLSNCDEDFKKAQLVCDAIDDFDIMTIVDFARDIVKGNKLALLVKENVLSYDLISFYFNKLTTIDFRLKNDLEKTMEDVKSFRYLFVLRKREELEFFNDILFCLNNMRINYFVVSSFLDDNENSSIIKLNYDMGDFIEIVFLFYIQLIVFYVSLFQNINPDLVEI